MAEILTDVRFVGLDCWFYIKSAVKGFVEREIRLDAGGELLSSFGGLLRGGKIIMGKYSDKLFIFSILS